MPFCCPVTTPPQRRDAVPLLSQRIRRTTTKGSVFLKQLNRTKRNIFLEKVSKFDKIHLIDNPVNTKP
jgi:hypothetical protein